MTINFDNKILQMLSAVFDCVWIALLWLLCGLPVITMGASTTAALSVLMGVDREKNGVTVRFFRAFKNNFKLALGVQLILICACAVLAADIYICWSGMMPQALQTITQATTALLVFAFAVVCGTVYGVAAKLKVTVKQAFYNVLYLSLKKPIWTFVLALLAALSVLALALLFAVAIVPLAAVLYLQAKIFNHILAEALQEKENAEARGERNLEAAL